MKPEAQRIAIAEQCGWEEDPIWAAVKTETHCVYRKHGARGRIKSELPDYLNDLNAMQTAVLALDDEQKYSFNSALMEQFKDERFGLHKALNATAAQRAEAFLRTKGLWTE